jgi:hypothetical protein
VKNAFPCQGKKESEKEGKRVPKSFSGKLEYNPEEKVIILWTFSNSLFQKKETQ